MRSIVCGGPDQVRMSLTELCQRGRRRHEADWWPQSRDSEGRPPVRRTLSILAAAAVVAGLAACSSSAPTASSTSTPGAASTACKNVTAGDVSKSVKVQGAFGSAPKVTIAAPLKAKDLERS